MKAIHQNTIRVYRICLKNNLIQRFSVPEETQKQMIQLFYDASIRISTKFCFENFVNSPIVHNTGLSAFRFGVYSLLGAILASWFTQ